MDLTLDIEGHRFATVSPSARSTCQQTIWMVDAISSIYARWQIDFPGLDHMCKRASQRPRLSAIEIRE
jgi:hypothetical protein